MLSWLRRFPHDVIHSKKQGGGGGSNNRRAASSTSWRNKSNSFTARIMRRTSTALNLSGRQQQDDDEDDEQQDSPPGKRDSDEERRLSSSSAPRHPPKDDEQRGSMVAARAFTFRELAAATGSFRAENLIGEGGFGRVYKGRLGEQGKETVMEVAVKQLDRNGPQGNGEFVVEVLMLSLLHHPNLVSLVGYCAEGEQRLLVYPLMPRGSLENHLLLVQPEEKEEVLPWRARMRIAHGAARVLEYLHDRGVIFRDLKPSNILLDADYNAKLSDFGLAKLLPPKSSSSSSGSSTGSGRVMGTYGYCAPEYLRTGRLSVKSDVYSFGVLLLELVTGRRAIDPSRPDGEQSLVAWAAALLGQPTRLHELLDPRLVMAMQAPPTAELNQAVGVATMCLQEHHALRPVMADVVTTLAFLATDTTDAPRCSSSSSCCILPTNR